LYYKKIQVHVEVLISFLHCDGGHCFLRRGHPVALVAVVLEYAEHVVEAAGSSAEPAEDVVVPAGAPVDDPAGATVAVVESADEIDFYVLGHVRHRLYRLCHLEQLQQQQGD